MTSLPHNPFLRDEDFDLEGIQSIDEIVAKSKKILTDGAFEWVEGGSESGRTANLNQTYLDSIGLLPEVLTRVDAAEFSQDLFGVKISSPIIAAPMGHMKVFHELGEEGFFTGLKATENLGILSSLSRTSLETISDVQSGAPFGFQIYPYGDRDWMLELIEKAEASGANFGVVTLDSQVRAANHSKRSDFDARKYGSGQTLVDTSIDLRSSFDWDDLEWLSKNSPIPLIPKGLFTDSNLKKFVKIGIEGFWISNHGGRALESLIHPLQLVANSKRVRKRYNRRKKDTFPIIVDGGFRYGSDILRALSLGADFVGVGRPFLHGLVVGGAGGVSKVASILNSELLVSMQLAGLRSIGDSRNLQICNMPS